jgi:hypothetical protein
MPKPLLHNGSHKPPGPETRFKWPPVRSALKRAFRKVTVQTSSSSTDKIVRLGSASDANDPNYVITYDIRECELLQNNSNSNTALVPVGKRISERKYTSSERIGTSIYFFKNLEVTPFLSKNKVMLTGSILVDNSESGLTSNVNNVGGMSGNVVYRKFISGHRDFMNVNGFFKQTTNDDGTRIIDLYIYSI